MSPINLTLDSLLANINYCNNARAEDRFLIISPYRRRHHRVKTTSTLAYTSNPMRGKSKSLECTMRTKTNRQPCVATPPPRSPHGHPRESMVYMLQTNFHDRQEEDGTWRGIFSVTSPRKLKTANEFGSLGQVTPSHSKKRPRK